MVKDCDGFMGGFRFKSQCGQHMEKKKQYLSKKKKIRPSMFILKGTDLLCWQQKKDQKRKEGFDFKNLKFVST